jgi:hypothetical protein
VIGVIGAMAFPAHGGELWDDGEEQWGEGEEEGGELEIHGYAEGYGRWTRTGAKAPFVGDATLRRVSIEVEKEFEGLPLESEIELEWENAIACDGCRGSVEAEEAFLRWSARPWMDVDVGLILVPFGRVNLEHAPTDRFSADRPMVDQTAIPTTWRELGVGVSTEGPFRVRGGLLTAPDPTRMGLGGLGPAESFGSHVRANAIAAVVRIEGEPKDGIVFAGGAYGADLGGNGDFYDDDGTRLDLSLPLLGVEADIDAEIGRVTVRGEMAGFSFPEADILLLARREDGSPYFSEDPFTAVASRWWGAWIEAGVDVLPASTNQHLTPFARLEAYDTSAAVPEGRRRDPARDVVDWVFGAAWQPLEPLIVSVDADLRDRRLGLDDRIVEVGVGWVW